MKLTIDTKHDTHEDIRKVLHILTHILERKEGSIDSTNSLESSPNTETNSEGFMNMFGDPTTESKEEAKDETAPDFSNFMNLVNKKDDDEKKEPKLEFF